MSANTSRSTRRTVPLYLACYALWITLSGLGLWAAFQWLNTVPDVVANYTLNPRVVNLAGNASAILLVLIWLSGMVFLESYLREGVPIRRLRARSIKVLAIVLVVLGLAYAIQAIA